jgi:hypothetical protein
VQNLAVAAQLSELGAKLDRLRRAESAQPLGNRIGGEIGLQGELATQRQLDVGPVHGGLVRHPAGPEAGAVVVSPAPYGGLRPGRPNRVHQLTGAVAQPDAKPVRVRGCGHTQRGLGRGGGGPGDDRGGPPMGLPDVLGELVQGPVRAGRHPLLQVDAEQRLSEQRRLRSQRVEIAIIAQWSHQCLPWSLATRVLGTCGVGSAAAHRVVCTVAYGLTSRLASARHRAPCVRRRLGCFPRGGNTVSPRRRDTAAVRSRASPTTGCRGATSRPGWTARGRGGTRCRCRGGDRGNRRAG